MPAITALSDRYHVCPQLDPSDVADIAALGYAVLVCMRPDDEASGQPRWKQVEAQAHRHGLTFHFIPTRSGAVMPEQVERLREVLEQAEGLVLSYCASGNRCTLAWRMAVEA